MDNTSRSSSPDIMGDGDDDRESSAPPSPSRNLEMDHERPLSRPNNTQSAASQQSGSMGSPRSPSPGRLSRNSGGSPQQQHHRHSQNGSPIEVGGPMSLATSHVNNGNSSKSGSSAGGHGGQTQNNSFNNHLFNSFGHERWVVLILCGGGGREGEGDCKWIP